MLKPKHLIWLFAAVFVTCWTSASAQRSSRVQNIPCGAAKLRVVEESVGEEAKTDIMIFGENGKFLPPALRGTGEFVSLCKHQRFAVIYVDEFASGGGWSFLADVDAKVLKRFEFGQVTSFGSSEDQKIFWTQAYSGGGFDKPTSRLTVVDLNGNIVLEKNFSDQAIQDLQYENKSYRIEVAKPVVPG